MLFKGDQSSPAWFFYMTSAPAVRCWSGVRNITVPADLVDETGGIYRGMGALVRVPSLTLPLNGAFVQHQFTLSGVAQEFLRLVNADRHTVRGATLSIGLTEVAPDGSLAEPIDWLCDLRVDSPRVMRAATPQGAERAVSILATAGDSLRRQRHLTRWTPTEQRSRPGSSDDAFCDMTVKYDVNSTEKWA